MAAKTRRTYAGAAASTTLAAGINSSDATISLAAATGWAAGPFYAVIDPGTASEEKIYVSSRSTTTLTVGTRGADGTTAKSHSAGAVIYPVHAAVDSDEANELTSTYTTRGDIVYQGSSTFTRLGVGSADQVLKTNGTDPSWGQVGTNGIADDAVTAAKIATGAVGATEIADGSVGINELATAVINKLVPVGTIAMYGGASAPTGWLLCNGDAINASYTSLIAIVGANTPDLKGRFALGDNTSLNLLDAGGSTTIAESNLPSHSHSINHDHPSATTSGQSQSHSHAVGYSNLYGGTEISYGASTPQQGTFNTGNASQDHTHTFDVPAFTGTSGTTGSGTAYYPPYVVVNYIIKHD